MSTENTIVGSVLQEKNENLRGEIDTSAPFESVKEAVTRFGGIGFWRPNSNKQNSHIDVLENVDEGFDISKLEEEAAQLQRDLLVKERETLDALKEIEKAKLIVEQLKFKVSSEDQNMVHDHSQCSAPDFILKELKRAKLNLTRTTDGLVDIRATVALYKQKVEKERASMEMRLSSNVSNISSLEEKLPSDGDRQSPDDPADISNELQILSTETEQFRKMGEAARSEILKAVSEIEHTKTVLNAVPAHGDVKQVSKPGLSIGQILSRKLLLTEDYENGVLARKSTGKRKVSLGQMLGKRGCEIQSDGKGDKENNPQQLPAKRKNFGFAKISFLRTKQIKKKKKRSSSPRSRSSTST